MNAKQDRVASVSKQRINTRLRVRKHRALAEKSKRDPERYYQVPLPASVVNEIVTSLQVQKQQDISVSDREWQRTVGDVIAEVIKLTVKDKRNALRPIRK
jgi:hypothetical protein